MVKEAVPQIKKRYRVLEIFTWCMAITQIAFGRNWDTLEPVDALNGWDLRSAQVRKTAFDYVDRESPIAWPCTNFSTIQNLNRSRVGFDEKLALARKRDEVFIRFAYEVTRLQMRKGRHVLLENPLTSRAWRRITARSCAGCCTA